jgi:ankyrin repeat protein
VEVISLLQKAGAQLMAKNRLGETALHLAVSQGRVEVAEYLLDVCPALLNTADT